MRLYECFVKGSTMVEAESPEEARGIYAQLVASEPTEEFIYAEEVEE